MPIQTSSSELTLPDIPDDDSTWEYGGTDRIDITVVGNNDARLELRGPGGAPWDEGKPIRVRGGSLGGSNFRSITGLSIAYPPRGVQAFRLSNWTPGKAAIVDVEAYSTG
jgi:hypothetical protein